MNPLSRRSRSSSARKEEESPAYAISGDGSALRQSVGEATARIQEIIDAAERIAQEIRTDAEKEAARYLAEMQAEADRTTNEQARLLTELTDNLLRHAHAVREKADAMVRGIEETVAQVRDATISSPPPDGAAASEPSTPPESSAGPSSPTRPSTLTEPSKAPPRRKQKKAEATNAVAPNAPAEPKAPAEGSAPPAPAPPAPVADASSGDVTDTAMLRATQMAVAGSGREEIRRTLLAEFGVDDPSAIVDEILGPH